MQNITAGTLWQHVEFLASDKLKGRFNPSPGLDAAAKYIADQFKKAGLEPASGNSYLQAAEMTLLVPDFKHYTFNVEGLGHKLKVAPADIILLNYAALDLDHAQIVHIGTDAARTMPAPEPGAFKGKVVMHLIGAAPVRWTARMKELEPAFTVLYGPNAARVASPSMLVWPDTMPPSQVLQLPVHTDELLEVLKSLPSGPTQFYATVHFAPPTPKKVVLNNVAGILRGSDPALAGTHLVVTANYDSLPPRRKDDDLYYNGANTNASGTAAMIEVAATLAKMKPKRSILFLARFGEINNGMGGEYYLKQAPARARREDGGLDQPGEPRPDRLYGRSQRRNRCHHWLPHLSSAGAVRQSRGGGGYHCLRGQGS